MNEELSLYFRGKQHNWLAPTFPGQQILEEGSTALINLSSQLWTTVPKCHICFFKSASMTSITEIATTEKTGLQKQISESEQALWWTQK